MEINAAFKQESVNTLDPGDSELSFRYSSFFLSSPSSSFFSSLLLLLLLCLLLLLVPLLLLETSSWIYVYKKAVATYCPPFTRTHTTSHTITQLFTDHNSALVTLLPLPTTYSRVPRSWHRASIDITEPAAASISLYTPDAIPWTRHALTI